MLHCADEIIALLNKHRRDTPMKADSSHAEHGKNGCNGKHPLDDESAAATLLDDAIEAAETIIYCALHQKRIVDDILTLSRLDSNLLVISPEPGQPVQLVRSATKMFEAELRRADMTLEIQEEPTIQQLNVEWTLLDPSRVLQIFINLMTNAIKFTRAEETRHITVSIGASLRKPSEVEDIVEYIPQSQTAPDHTLAAEWGDGEILYLAMSVTDTGRGLSDQERKVLFHLFQQASPKTHVRYGGSGLGLFICRQLVEMQGGQIGVASEAGKGSTFRFFVKTRRTDPPPLQPSDSPMQEMVRHTSLGEACGLGPWTPQNDHYMPKAKRQRLNSSNGTNSPKPLGLHVLVVEDNLVNQKVASKQLRNCGYSVHVANHGEEALEFLKRTEYWNSTSGGEKLSVVLMDLEMPIMDGITCVKKIRELQAEGVIRGHVPVIAVTANARKDQIMDALSAGMVSSLISWTSKRLT
jgi:signal transduction histidine kinase/CheY-like chemotaxis protein